MVMNKTGTYIVAVIIVAMVIALMVKVTGSKTVVGEAAASCVDTDGGLNYKVKGKVATSTTGSVVDNCLGPSFLTENYCSGSMNASVNKNCVTLGYVACVNGACV